MFQHSILIDNRGTLFGEWSSEESFRNSEAPVRTWREQEIEGRKIWENNTLYLQEFMLEEMAAISLSTNPTIAALRLLLASWNGEVWSDDPRVVAGLDAIEAAGIINSERRSEILAP